MAKDKLLSIKGCFKITVSRNIFGDMVDEMSTILKKYSEDRGFKIETNPIEDEA